MVFLTIYNISRTCRLRRVRLSKRHLLLHHHAEKRSLKVPHFWRMWRIILMSLYMPQWMNTHLALRRPSIRLVPNQNSIIDRSFLNEALWFILNSCGYAFRCLGCLKLSLKEMLKQRRLRAHFLSKLLYLSKDSLSRKNSGRWDCGGSKHVCSLKPLPSSGFIVLSTYINKQQFEMLLPEKLCCFLHLLVLPNIRHV